MACTHDSHEEMTYLDRDQAYLISITDTAPSPVSISFSPAKYRYRYRTSIHVSFENEEQKCRSAYYWNLWQSGHVRKAGITDSRPPKGLEFEASSALLTGIVQNVNFHLENTHVDRFTFTWTTMASKYPQCQFAVSFHFVSTDFSQAKGVKGLPLRLSALTREITLASTEELRNDLQIQHCLIKVYRNHGAERKKVIDCKQIEKKIEKVRHQIASQKNALRAKVIRDRYKRRKLSSEDSLGQAELPADHVLVVELERLELAARRPRISTTFHLRGEPEDYSDRYTLTPPEDPNDFLQTSLRQPGENTPAFLSTQWDNTSDVAHPILPTLNLVPPTNLPINSELNESNTFEHVLGMASPISNPTLDPSLSPSLVQIEHESKCPANPIKWIKVIDADPSYRRPKQIQPKAGT